MIIRDKIINLGFEEIFLAEYNMKDMVFFDIEASLDKNGNEFIWAISLGRFIDNNYIVTQYFAEKIKEEKTILENAKVILDEYYSWCTFNGLSFDEPFLIKRSEKFNLNLSKPKDHFDLYRFIFPYYKSLKVKGCGLKALEKGIGINRTDSIDGYESRILYNEYLISNDEEIMYKLMNHNIEDVISLPKLFRYVNEIKERKLVRSDKLTEAQKKSMKHLLKKRVINLDIKYDNISKKCAGKIIHGLISRSTDKDEIESLIKKGY